MLSQGEMFWATMDEMNDAVYRASHEQPYLEDGRSSMEEDNDVMLGQQNEDPSHGSWAPASTFSLNARPPGIASFRVPNDDSVAWDELDSVRSVSETSTPQAVIPPLPPRAQIIRSESSSHESIADDTSIIQEFSMDFDRKEVPRGEKQKPSSRSRPVVSIIPNKPRIGKPTITSAEKIAVPAKRPLSRIAEPPTKRRRSSSPIPTDDSSQEEDRAHPTRKVERMSLTQALPKAIAATNPKKDTDPGRAGPGTISVLRLPGGKSIREEPIAGPSKKRPFPFHEESRNSKQAREKKGKTATKRPSVNPHEYIRLLNEGVYEPPGAARSHILGHATVFVVHNSPGIMVAGDFTTINMLARNGAKLLDTFDPEKTTHIICLSTSPDDTVTQLGDTIKDLKDIPPYIPTLKEKWVREVVGGAVPAQNKRYWPKFAAFVIRKNVGQAVAIPREKQALKPAVLERARKRKHSDSEDSSDDGEDIVASRSHPRELESNKGKSVAYEDDPLIPFYDLARKAHANSLGKDDDFDSGEDGKSENERTENISRSRWTSDRKPQETAACPNQDIIDKLEELRGLHAARPGTEDHWKSFAYSKAIRALRSYPTRIKSIKEAENIRGVGTKTAKKIMEIIETGKLKRIEYETTEDVLVARLFTGIYGIGTQKAHQLYMQGYRTLDDLRTNSDKIGLSQAQRIGLENYDDINSRMPREEAAELFSFIKPIAMGIDPKLDVQIMGSFRRGKATCGDIDILITRDPRDGKTHAGALRYLLKALRRKGIITDDLACPENPDDEECIYRGLCRLPNKEGAKKRRIDFLCIPWENRGAALIYYTGDDIFNRAIRYKADKMGYSLNQRGLWAGVVRDPRDRFKKLNDGTIIASSTEEEIFKILGVPWQEPFERIRNFT